MGDVTGALGYAPDEGASLFDLFVTLPTDDEHRGVVAVEDRGGVEVPEGRIKLVGALDGVMVESTFGAHDLRSKRPRLLLPPALLFSKQRLALLVVLNDEAVAPPDLKRKPLKCVQASRKGVRGVASKGHHPSEALSEDHRIALHPVLGE